VSGACPSAVVLRHLAAASSAADARSGRRRLHVVPRSGRHRLDALEVDEQIDETDDERQRSDHEQRQNGRRLEDWMETGRRRAARGDPVPCSSTGCRRVPPRGTDPLW